MRDLAGIMARHGEHSPRFRLARAAAACRLGEPETCLEELDLAGHQFSNDLVELEAGMHAFRALALLQLDRRADAEASLTELEKLVVLPGWERDPLALYLLEEVRAALGR
jgi:hypothetical protein